MDVRSTLASLTYAQARPATAPAAGQGSATGSGFSALAGSFADTLRTGEETAKPR
jgi:flagellar hook-basal body complex protein FliE